MSRKKGTYRETTSRDGILSTRIPPDIAARIKGVARMTGKSQQSIVIDLVKLGLESQNEMKEAQLWIPVSKELPPLNDDCKEYLLTVAHRNPEYKARNTMIGTYDTRGIADGYVPGFTVYGDHTRDGLTYVTAWRELPEPYRGGAE